MTRKLSLAFVVALVVSAFFSAAALANCGKCGGTKAGCTAKASDSKSGCMKGQGANACPHMADMQAAFSALEKDEAAMEKGIAPADQAAFLKAHQANLKKLLDTKAACMKDCKMKAGAPAASPEKAAPKA